MAVANKKSTIVTALDAGKSVALRLQGAVLKSAVATVEVAAADDDGSVYRLFRVHSSWSPRHLWLLNDAITSGTVYDLGLYDTADLGGAVVTQEAFASDVAMASARVAPPGWGNHDGFDESPSATPRCTFVEERGEKRPWGGPAAAFPVFIIS